MKLRHLRIAALTSVFILGSHVSAGIIVSATEPTTDVLLDQYHGNTGSTAATNITSNQAARGSFFTLEDSAISGTTAVATAAIAQTGSNIGPNINAQIEAITFRVNSAPNTTADDLDIVFFTGNPAPN